MGGKASDMEAGEKSMGGVCAALSRGAPWARVTESGCTEAHLVPGTEEATSSEYAGCRMSKREFF
jgi:hypothetical protein